MLPLHNNLPVFLLSRSDRSDRVFQVDWPVVQCCIQPIKKQNDVMHNLKQHCDVTTRSWKKLADLSQSWSGMGLFPWRKAANLMCHISIEFIVLMIPEAVPFSPVRRNWNCSIRRSISCNKTRDTCQLERNTNWRISRTSLPFWCRACLAVQGVAFQSWLGVGQTSVQQRPPTTEPRSSYT